MTITNEELESLVNWREGIISPRIFTDEEIYQRELEEIFGHTWLFLVHESFCPNPGDFFSTYMGEDPVVVVRQNDGSFRALLNSCRHRGMQVCRADFGNLKAFTCTYHGWAYDIEGNLANVPAFEEGYHGELDMSKWGLLQVAQVEEYKGLVFGNFDPAAPPLLDYLGPMAWWLDSMLDRTAGGTEVTGSVHKLRFKGNWKLAAEQFAGDGYHGPVTHASAALGGTRGGSARYAPRNPDVQAQFSTRQGHGLVSFNRDGSPNGLSTAQFLRERGDDELADYYDRLQAEADQRLGPNRPRSGASTVFPNFSYLHEVRANSTIGVWHPHGPNSFEQWRFVLVDKSASPREKHLLNAAAGVWPFGLADADDGENWSEIGRNMTRSPKVRSLPLNYQMGINYQRDDDPEFPGIIGYGSPSESSQRTLYRRWLEFMTADGAWPIVEDRGWVRTSA